jgi:hypothetical protein
LCILSLAQLSGRGLFMVTHACNLADWEVEVVGLWSEAGPGKSTRPYMKNNLNLKGLRLWHEW